MKVFKFIPAILFFIIILLVPVHAQRVISYGIQINPGYCWLSGGIPSGAEGFSKESAYAINFGITGKYYFSKVTAIQTGFQVNNYSYKLTAKSYSAQFQTIDSENKSYQRIISGDSVSESSSLTLLNIPVCFVYEIPLNRNIHLYASVGPSLAIPIKSSLKGSGTFSYKGYYEEGNYTLENISIYGFNNNVPVNVNEKMNTALLSIHANASAGCIFTINRYWKFVLNLNYSSSFTSIVKNNSNYYISNELGRFHSILENKASKLNSVSFGISIQKLILF
jgi:hypothetical protein